MYCQASIRQCTSILAKNRVLCSFSMIWVVVLVHHYVQQADLCSDYAIAGRQLLVTAAHRGLKYEKCTITLRMIWTQRWFTFALYENEVRFFDLVFLHGASCQGALDPRSKDFLGNQHHAEKLSQRIALHFRKVRK